MSRSCCWQTGIKDNFFFSRSSEIERKAKVEKEDAKRGEVGESDGDTDEEQT